MTISIINIEPYPWMVEVEFPQDQHYTTIHAIEFYKRLIDWVTLNLEEGSWRRQDISLNENRVVRVLVSKLEDATLIKLGFK